MRMELEKYVRASKTKQTNMHKENYRIHQKIMIINIACLIDSTKFFAQYLLKIIFASQLRKKVDPGKLINFSA